jgi:hypothetical protein
MKRQLIEIDAAAKLPEKRVTGYSSADVLGNRLAP